MMLTLAINRRGKPSNEWNKKQVNTVLVIPAQYLYPNVCVMALRPRDNECAAYFLHTRGSGHRHARQKQMALHGILQLYQLYRPVQKAIANHWMYKLPRQSQTTTKSWVWLQHPIKAMQITFNVVLEKCCFSSHSQLNASYITWCRVTFSNRT